MVNAALALMWQYLNAEDDLVYVLRFISSRTCFPPVSLDDQAMGKQQPDVWFPWPGRSEEVVPLARCFVEKVQKDKELTEEDKEHLRKLLTILANKMKYDSSYDFSKPDQIEQEFLQYRKV
jgi:hypothetical protein